MTYFDGKVAVVTGGTSGIGQAVGEALARGGAVVYLAGRRLERAQISAQKLNDEGCLAHARQLDVTDQTAFENLIQEITQAHGRIDIAVNNAGIAIGGDARDVPIDQWRKVLAVNLMGVLYGTHAVYRHMTTQGSGQIVNIASVAGLVEYPGNAPYATSKFAVVGMSRTLRAEGRALGVKVNVVCPGYIRTEIFEAAEMINIKPTDLAGSVPFKMMKVEDAAQRILKGMRKNEAVMVFPGHAKLLLFLNRYLPWVSRRISQKMIGELRRLRQKG